MDTKNSTHTHDFTIAYPHDALHVHLNVHEKQCFFIMEYDEERKKMYNSISEFLFKQYEVGCVREDLCIEHGIVMADIINKIISSHYIIADVSSTRGNIFYELGIAHCFKKMGNVIIITREGETPIFDLNAYRYITYKVNQYEELAIKLANIIVGDKSQNDLLASLCHYRVIESSEKEYVRNMVLCDIGPDVQDLYDMISGQESINKKAITLRLFVTCKKSLQKDEIRKSRVLFKILSFVIAKGKIESAVEKEFSALLDSKSSYYNHTASDVIDQLQTDFVLVYTSFAKYYRPVMEWITKYFSRSKSTTIDLNRHRLEEFLVTTNDPLIEDSIIAGLSDSERHIREHMADIIGARKMEKARQSLIKSLKNENWPYCASAMIVALGKLEPGADAIEAIKTWLDEHENWLLEKCYYFIINRIANSLDNLDRGRTEGKIIRELYKNQLAVYERS